MIMYGFNSEGKKRWSDGKPLTAAMDNVLASKLGKVYYKVLENNRNGIGDSIDAGLILRRYLEEAGFEVSEKR